MSATQRRPRAKRKATTLRLNLGCGNTRIDDFVGVDFMPSDAVDVSHDLTQFPWPWDDNSVDEIIAFHLIEHIPMVEVDYPGFERPIDAMCAFMNEVYRVLKPGSGIKLQYPHHASDRAFWDPTHRRFIPPMTWNYFTKAWLEGNNLTQMPITCNFEILSIGLEAISDRWAQRTEEVKMQAIEEYRNVVADTSVILKKPEDA